MNTEQINELRKLAQAVIGADSSGDAIEAAIEFMKAAGPQEFLDLIQQRDELLAALKDARELVDDWGAYAPAYMQEKHDLAGDLDRLYSVITKAEAQS